MRVYLSHAWRNHSSTLSTGPSFGANHARDILLTVAFVLYRRTLLLRRSSLQSSRLTLFSSCAPPCTRFPVPGGAETSRAYNARRTVVAGVLFKGETFYDELEAKHAGSAQLEAFAAPRQAARAFLDALAVPPPTFFASSSYFALIAFELTSPTGAAQYVCYSFVPVTGTHPAAPAPNKGPNFLYDEVAARMAACGAVSFELWAQLAQPGDATDDITSRWPADRERVLLGQIVLEDILEHNAEMQREIVFDPVPRVRGRLRTRCSSCAPPCTRCAAPGGAEGA